VLYEIRCFSKIFKRNTVLPDRLEPHSMGDAKVFENSQEPETPYFG
jgi:hypothetical protein